VLDTGGQMWEAIHRLRDPQPVQGIVVIGVAIAGVVVNGITAFMLHHGHEHDLNVKGAYLHMLGDAAVSCGVAVAGALVLATGWLWLDPAVTIVVGIAIVWSSLGLLRDSTNLALHAVPAHIDADAVRDYLERLPGVESVHDLHIWAMSTTSNALTAHLVMPGGLDGNKLLEEAQRDIASRFGIQHVTLQVEMGNCGQAC
jgi:cobalt-zinc-cadmium efflux system protein